MVWAAGIGQNRLSASAGASRSGTAAGYSWVMRDLKVLSRVGLVFTALLLSGCDSDTEEVFSEYLGLTTTTILPMEWGPEPKPEPEMLSSAAPMPDSETPATEPDTETSAEPGPDGQQPVSDLQAEFHFAKSADTFGCPFMQVVDVAGVADNADVLLKLSVDGTSVKHKAEFITEGEYVEEGFDGYFDLVAGKDFDAALEGEHSLQVEVSDGVGSVTIEGKFTADSCPPN